MGDTVEDSITIFANYGVLGHEKEAVWSITPADAGIADDSERVICKLPDGYSAGKNEMDEPIVIDKTGEVNILADALPKRTALGEDPYLVLATTDNWHKVPLTVAKREPWTPATY